MTEEPTDPTRRIDDEGKRPTEHLPETDPTRIQPQQPGTGDDGGGGSRTAVVIGALVAAVAGVVVAVLLIGGGDDKTKTVTSTGPTTTVTTTTTQETTDTTTTTPGITQAAAASAAESAASNTASQGGIDIPPSDFDARCTAQGGTSTSSTWNCDVTSSSGQCSGLVVVEATADGGTAIQENQIGCGE